MMTIKESVHLKSLGDELAGTLFYPDSKRPAPVLIICHGAGEFKENYYELCELLASRGVATLAIDMHGHGQSASSFSGVVLCFSPEASMVLGMSLETYTLIHVVISLLAILSGLLVFFGMVANKRMDALTALFLATTVLTSVTGFFFPLPLPMTLFLKLLVGLGRIKMFVTKRDLRLPLAKMSGGLHLASDPELDKRIQTDPKALAAFNDLPFPGAAQAFFVNTIKRVSKIAIPTLVLWGEDDKVDPPETGRMLFAALTCKKELHIIAGNGHVGHLDRNRDKVFSLTANWALENLP